MAAWIQLRMHEVKKDLKGENEAMKFFMYYLDSGPDPHGPHSF
jgi:hypothetical protein